jgi:hypothetical protein
VSSIIDLFYCTVLIYCSDKRKAARADPKPGIQKSACTLGAGGHEQREADEDGNGDEGDDEGKGGGA